MPKKDIEVIKDKETFQKVFNDLKPHQVDVMPTNDMRYMAFVPNNGPVYMVDMYDIFKFLMEE